MLHPGSMILSAASVLARCGGGAVLRDRWATSAELLSCLPMLTGAFDKNEMAN